MEKRIIEHLESMCEAPAEIEIISTEKLGEAIFAKFLFNKDDVQVAVYYPQDDMLFTPTDWQGGHPRSAGEIQDYSWMDSAGDIGVVMEGLPRAFSAARDEARKEFGVRVRALREERGLTAEELGRRAGLQRPNLARIESGRYNVTLDTMTKLGAALGVKLA